MKFIVDIPDTYFAERSYIVFVILKEFLGLDYVFQRSGSKNYRISDKDRKGCLIIPDDLFSISEEKWLTIESLPKQPLEVWNPCTMGFESRIEFQPVPVIYGSHKADLNSANHSCRGSVLYLPVDIFGSCFFMLTRYEELVKHDRDEHDRFPVKAMVGYQEEFVDRPIVNEYIEILWACLKRLWPNLTRKKREYHFFLSHDVDDILCVVGKPLKQVIRRVGGDIIVRRDLNLAIKSMHAAWKGVAEKDPCNTFDIIMYLSEKNGIKSEFNFMADTGYSAYDQKYSIDSPWARHCIRRIIQRGHLIGFHPTYGSYLNREQTKNEFIRLKNAAEEEGAKQNEWGGRQHYLRWKNPETWQHWQYAGLDYDSTVGFADTVGFRVGCCYEYPVFNIKERKKINLYERPLIVMEGTITEADGSITSQSIEKIVHLKNLCKKYAGDFTLLWHNNNIISFSQRKGYFSTISALV